MSDDGGTPDPAEPAPPAKGLPLFWAISVTLTALAIPVTLFSSMFIKLANNGCDPGGSPTSCHDHWFVLPILIAALALAVVSYVTGGILAARRPKARAMYVHWMSFVISAVVYAAGYVVAWSTVTSG